MTLLAVFAAPAFACSLLAPEPFSIADDPTDTVAPATPELVAVDVKRGKGAVGGGMSSCDDLGWVSIALAQPDGEAVGYVAELVDGELPEGMALPTEPVASELLFTWGDGATRAQEPLSFVLAVTPVDAAGNLGDPLTVEVDDPGSAGGGCDATGGAASGLGALLGAVAVRRARRRTG